MPDNETAIVRVERKAVLVALVAVFVTVAIAILAGGMWAGATSTQLSSHEKRLDTIDSDLHGINGKLDRVIGSQWGALTPKQQQREMNGQSANDPPEKP
ncbi:MAG: hypothetical protein ABSB74_06815 [Tepidisphaeraceae bacterium]